MTTTATQREGDAACAFTSAPRPDTHTETQEGPVESTNAPRDTFLDPWRFARSEAAQGLVELILASLAQFHHQRGTDRSLRANYLRKWEDAAAAIVCALALAVLLPPPTGRLVLPRQKEKAAIARRYRTPLGDGRMIARLQDQLVAARLMIVERPEGRGMATTVRPSPLFVELVAAGGLAPRDFGREDRRELVALGEVSRVEGRRKRVDRDYEDTPETNAMRADVERINAHLAKADISYDGFGPMVDISDRRLRRCFTLRPGEQARFDQGGRFFGVFWQKMRKADRQHLRINGEPIVELDYSAAFTHLAFAAAGKTAPAADDLYRIPGLEGLERRQIKAAINTLYFDDHRRRTWPAQFDDDFDWSDPETGEVFAGFSPAFTPTRVRAAILAHYPDLAVVLGTGQGLGFMFTESEIMRRLLLTLADRDITALPLHDAVAVAYSDAPVVQRLMMDMAMETIGSPIPVAPPEASLSLPSPSLLY